MPLECRELVEKLHAKNVAVYLISGGFTSIITPVANQLRIPLSNVIANRLLFFHEGMYSYTQCHNVPWV
jgi:phosphoserine phosphatase